MLSWFKLIKYIKFNRFFRVLLILLSLLGLLYLVYYFRSRKKANFSSEELIADKLHYYIKNGTAFYHDGFGFSKGTTMLIRYYNLHVTKVNYKAVRLAYYHLYGESLQSSLSSFLGSSFSKLYYV